MALISAKTILTSLSFFHITLAFFFFTNPATIADQALVYVLGESMGMPQTAFFDTPSPPTSILSLLLLLVGLSDLVTLSLPEEIWLVHYWGGAQAPLRILLFFALTVFTFLTAPSSAALAVPSASSAKPPGRPLTSHPRAAPTDASYGTASGWDGLRNRVFFTFAFLEMLSWFWVWVTLREEQRAVMAAARRRRRRSQDVF